MKQIAPDVIETKALTYEGAQRILEVAIAHARSIGVRVTVSVCDRSGVLLAMGRMTGADFTTIETSLNKAATAASSAKPTGTAADPIAIKLGVASYGKYAGGLKGGVPIIVEGHVIGGVGAGGATGDQDREISFAAVRSIAGSQVEFG
jgi:uncharacterized protein GlcG (DUF336 family)